MKLIVVSDLHFGDKQCRFDPATFFPKLEQASAFDPPADFIVLLGDVFDFSVASYADAYRKAQPFFQALNGRVRDIIYVPGNHDGDFWHLIDNQINVLKQMENNRSPNPLMMTCPAVLFEQGGGFDLCWTKPNLMSYRKESARDDRAGLFVDSLVTGLKISETIALVKQKKQWPPRFWVAYPNLYLVTPEETILLTHGHYLETWWALGGEVAARLCRSCFRGVHIPDPLETYRRERDHFTSLHDLVGLNYPLSQLVCSGLGQAGKLQQYAKEVQAQAKDHNLTVIGRLMRRLPTAASRSFVSPRAHCWEKFKADVADVLAEAGAWVGMKAAGRQIKKLKPFRGKSDAFDTPEAEDRLERYLFATGLEVDELNRFAAAEEKAGRPRPFPRLSAPTKMIFGHTHQPITTPARDDHTRQEYLNCGGFVNDGKPVAFIYEKGKISVVDLS